jgi:hypothetical protein
VKCRFSYCYSRFHIHLPLSFQEFNKPQLQLPTFRLFNYLCHPAIESYITHLVDKASLNKLKTHVGVSAFTTVFEHSYLEGGVQEFKLVHEMSEIVIMKCMIL